MSDFKTETLNVKPITYKLDIDDEQLKKLRPFFKVSSGSFSGITKTVNHLDKNEDEIRIRKKEEGSVLVELWDRNSSRPENLIGRGEVKYDSLSNREGMYEEWIPLLDRNNKQVGKALVEIDVTPVQNNLSFDDMFKRSIQDMNHSFRRAIEDMNRSFEHFNHFLPGTSFPSLMSSSPRQQAIKSEGHQEKVTSPKKQAIKSEGHQEKLSSPRKEIKHETLPKKDIKPETNSPKKELKHDTSSHGTLSTRDDSQRTLMTPSRRNWFDSTFEDMHNMFERTIEDMHNTFEQFTKDFFPSGFKDFLGEDERRMDLEDEKPVEKSNKSPVQENRRKANVSDNKDKVEIQEEPLRP